MNNLNTHNNDDNFDRALRPTRLVDFLGQEDSKYNLQVYIHGAMTRGEALDHILLAGPPGLGKTTLAGIISNEMRANVVVVNAPSIKTKAELAALLTGLKKNDILFLDEIHSLNPKVEEVLYPAMEDYKLEIVAGSQALTIPLEPFTLIGATTRAGMLQRPLRDRFGVIINMKLYSNEELSHIIKRSSRKLGVRVSEDGAQELARRSRGTPRIANRLLRRIRDFAAFNGFEVINSEIVEVTCERLGIDKLGLDVVMQRYLKILTDKGIPVALNTVVAILGDSKDTVENIIEPYLLQHGLIEKTPKGRQATPAAYRHIYPEN